ncbi:MAG: hypothetical protein ACXWP5_14165, partial [Bdellovibrionota bacterium]
YFYDIMGYLPQKFTQDAVVPDASGKNIGAVGWGIGSENAGVGAGNSHGNFQAFLGYENINRTGEIRAGVLLQGNSWNVWANDTSGVVNRDTSPGESKVAMLQLTFTPRVTQKGEKHEYTNEVREMADWRKKPQMKSAPVAVAVVGALPSQAVMAAAASAAVVAPITAAAAAAQ